MNLQNRVALLQQLNIYLSNNPIAWQEAKAKATAKNGWFTPEFIDLAVENICTQFLTPDKLHAWMSQYALDDTVVAKNIGIVMAGNIPLVGFHDFLCAFICGHQQTIKLSSKDDVLLKHLVQQLYHWEVTIQNYIGFAEILKGCDAYIATGSNNSATHFEYYFGKYPSIIRRNRTSVAILDGNETAKDLANLADDVHLFFGLGCRNVTKIFVPEGYHFEPLIAAFKKYAHFADHHKYRNNYDYNLSLHLLNNKFYMSSGAILLSEQVASFAPVGQLNFGFYHNKTTLVEALAQDADLQCIAGTQIPYGQAQRPGLSDYADGVDTMTFLLSL
jgi:hypothetical protein